MPTLKAWVATLLSTAATIGGGILTVKYLTPTDEQFLNELSPEIRAKVEKEKDMRELFQKKMTEEIQKTKHDPAFFKGREAMRKLDDRIAKEVYAELQNNEKKVQYSEEKNRLKGLASKEK